MADRRKLLLALSDPSLRKPISEIALGLNAEMLDVPPAELSLKSEPGAVVVTQDPAGDAKIEEILPQLRAGCVAIVFMKTLDAKRAVELMKLGAWDCVEPNVEPERLHAIVRRAVEKSREDSFRIPPPLRWWQKRNVRVAAALFLFLAIAGGATSIWKQRHDRAERRLADLYGQKEYPLPYFHPSGITFDGADFWTCDWYAQSIYRHSIQNDGFKLLSVYHFSDINPVSLDWAGEDLWLVSTNKKIQRYHLKERMVLRQSVKSPGNQPSGIAFDGKNLYTADAAGRKVYRHKMDSALTVEAEMNYPGAPVALFWSGTQLWSLDSEKNRILRHRIIEDKLLVEEEIQPGEKYRRVAATWDGKRFWTLAERPSLAIRHAIEPPASEKADR